MKPFVVASVRRARANLAVGLLALLLLADALWALVFVAHFHVAAFASDRWDLSLEGSYAEWYGHVIEAAIVVVLLALFRRHGQFHYLAWAATFLYVGIDDTIQIHEHAGVDLVRLLGGHDSQFGIRHQDIGELLSWAVAGAIFGYVLWRTWRTGSADAKADGLQLAGAFGLLLFCGMFLDTVDRVIDTGWHQILRLMVIAEDGGELVALSLAVASVVAFLRRSPGVASRRVVGRAVEANGVAVGVVDLAVAIPPEGVERRKVTRVAGGGERRVHLVDRFTRGQP